MVCNPQYGKLSVSGRNDTRSGVAEPGTEFLPGAG